MSGVPPLATELRTSLVVRFVPNSEVDYFDRPKQQAVLSSDSWWRIVIETDSRRRPVIGSKSGKCDNTG
jgi:hypothetical protein